MKKWLFNESVSKWATIMVGLSAINITQGQYVEGLIILSVGAMIDVIITFRD